MTRIPQPRSPGRPRTTPPPISHAKTPPAEDAVETTATAEDDVPAGPPPVDALSEMMVGLQGAANSRISIYRIVKNQPPSYVAECAPESFSLDDLRDKYRGGEFRLYVMKDGRLWKNMRVFVEPPVFTPTEHAAPPSHMNEMLTLIREGFAAQAAALREAAARPPSGVSSLLDGQNLPAVITAVTGAIVALRPPPPPAPPPPPVLDTSDRAIDMLMRGIELAQGLRESTSPADNSIGGMLRTFLQSPLMAQAVAAATTPARPAAPPQPRAALPAPSTPQQAQPQPQPQPQPAQPEAPDMTNVLHYYYGLLCQKAAAGADPVLYAEVVLDNVPDETLNDLLTRQPTPLDALLAEYPAAVPHRDWFATLIDTLMSAMTEEDVPEPSGGEAAPPINGAHADATVVQTPVVPGQPS